MVEGKGFFKKLYIRS